MSHRLGRSRNVRVFAGSLNRVLVVGGRSRKGRDDAMARDIPQMAPDAHGKFRRKLREVAGETVQPSELTLTKSTPQCETGLVQSLLIVTTTSRSQTETPPNSGWDCMECPDIATYDCVAKVDAPLTLSTPLNRFVFPAFSGFAMGSRTSS